MDAPRDGRAPLSSLLRDRDFLALWSGQMISQIGDSFTFLALLITVNRFTGSAAAMGVMMISLTLPQLVFSLLAGVVVDRVDRKLVMIISDLLRAALVLAFLTVLYAAPTKSTSSTLWASCCRRSVFSSGPPRQP